MSATEKRRFRQEVIVKRDGFTSTFRPAGNGMLHMEHSVASRQPQVLLDCFGKVWTFNIADVAPGLVRARRGSDLIPIEGRLGMIVSPFSLFEWHLAPGMVCFEALVSIEDLPHGLPDQPVCFPWDWDELPRSLAEIREIVASCRKHWLPIGLVGESKLAWETKQLIDRTYMGECEIVRLADKLGVARETLSRAFKADFGLSPVQYRNRLRVSESIPRLLIRELESITTIAHDVGFQDLSRFNKQFRRHRKVKPSEFRF